MQTEPTSLFLRGTALAVLVAFSASCGGYTSDYVPPKDGRARVLFHGERAVASLPAADVGCLRAIQESPSELPPYLVGRGGGGVTVVYWTPGIHVHASHSPVRVRSASGGGRKLATPVARSGSGVGGGGIGSVSGGGVKSSGVSGGGVKSSGGSGKGFGMGKGSGGMNGGKDLAVFLAVVALLLLPLVTIGMAVDSPGAGADVAEVMDRVNAYNDLARFPGSPCAPEVIIEEPSEAPEAPAPEAPLPAEVAP